MSQAAGLVVYFTRCNAPDRRPAWEAWLRDEHVPALAAVPGVRAGSHWALTQQPAPYMPSVGFTHVSLFELSGDVAEGARAITEREAEARAAGRLDPSHCVMDVDVLLAHGRFCDKPLPSEALSAHIMAYVMCNDPEREAEWDRWNDEVHMPDMLDSQAFTGVSRWVRATRRARGPQFVTLYDVGPDGIEKAVERSAAAMPVLTAAGRKHACHVGGLSITLSRA